VRLVLGGVAAGLVFGTLMLYWMGHAGRRHEQHDWLVQSAITISGAYLCFYISDVLLSVSAVLAVICAGTMLAVYMWPLVVDHMRLERFWHTIEWFMNTAVFLLAGLIIGGRCLLQIDPAWHAQPAADGGPPQGIGLSDLAWMGLSCVIVVVIRFITLFSLLPFLRRLGYGMSVRDAVAAAWGGLRGAVGLALALSMDEELEKRGETRKGKLVLLHTSGVILGSLVVNAPTMPLLISKLGLTPALATDGCRRQALLDVRKRVEKFAWREFRALQQHPRAPAGESWKERVVKAVTALQAGERRAPSAATRRGAPNAAGAPAAAAADLGGDGGSQQPSQPRRVVTLAEASGAVLPTARLGRGDTCPEDDVDAASIDTAARSSGSASAFSTDPLWSLAKADSYSFIPSALSAHRGGRPGLRHPTRGRSQPGAEARDPNRIGEAEEDVAAAEATETTASQAEAAKEEERADLTAAENAILGRNGAGEDEYSVPMDSGAGLTFMRQVTDEGGWWQGVHPVGPVAQSAAGSSVPSATAKRRWRIAVSVTRLVRTRDTSPPPAPLVRSITIGSPPPSVPPRPSSPPQPAVAIDVPHSHTDAELLPVPLQTGHETTRQAAIGAPADFGRSMRPSDPMPSGDEAVDTEKGRALMQARAIFLNLVKQSYHEQLAEGLVRRGPTRAWGWAGSGGAGVGETKLGRVRLG
jgi:hypothetical protein